MTVFDMVTGAEEAVEMQRIGECVVGADDACGTIEQLALATAMENNYVDFPCRNASISGDGRRFRRTIGMMMMLVVLMMKLMLYAVNVRDGATIHFRNFVHNFWQCEISMDLDFRRFCCTRCTGSNFFLFDEKGRSITFPLDRLHLHSRLP